VGERPATWALALAFGIVYITWGTTYLAIQRGVRDEQLPPALFGGTRVCLAGLVLLAYLALRGEPLSLPRRDRAGLVLAALLMFVGGNGLINLAEKTVNSGVAAVLVATTPLWIGLFGTFWPRGERLTGRGWLGLLVGMAGVLLLFTPRLQDAQLLLTDLGPFFVLGSACCWSLGSLVLRQCRITGSHLTAAAYQMILGGGALTLLGLSLGEASRLPERVTTGAAVCFLYLLIVGSLLGFVAFNWLLGHVSAAQAGTYAYVNPVVAVFIGWVDGEDLDRWMIAGICVILTGVALVRGGGVRKATSVDESLGREEAQPSGNELTCGGESATVTPYRVLGCNESAPRS
jgi:drug/metabolite transporter (DMT)-like permease